MDLINFFIPREEIAGLEINDRVLRLLLISEKGKTLDVKAASEVYLEEGVVVNGEVKDRVKVLIALKKLRASGKPAKVRTPNIIISFPERHVWQQIFDFPILKEEELNAAVGLNIERFSPFSFKETYNDFQKLPEDFLHFSPSRIYVLASAIKKEVLDPWLSLLKEAGFRVVALEGRGASLARSVGGGKKARLIIEREDEGMLFVIAFDGLVYFSSFSPWPEINFQFNKTSDKFEEKILKKYLTFKIRTLLNYFITQTDQESFEEIIFLCNEGEEKIFQSALEEFEVPYNKFVLPIKRFPFKGNWAGALGVALRGLIPRGKDTLNSLMPIGTEEAYLETKRLAFLNTNGLLLNTFAFFYGFVLLGFFFLLSYIQFNLVRSLETRQTIPQSTNFEFLVSKTEEVNNFSKQILALQESLYDQRSFLEALNQIRLPGIVLTSVSFNVLNGSAQISGQAAQREILLDFKKKLEETPGFSNIVLPLNLLGSKENINFSLNLQYQVKKRY